MKMKNQIRKIIGPALLLAGVSLCYKSNQYFDVNDKSRYNLPELREDINRLSNFERPSESGIFVGSGVLGIVTILSGLAYLVRKDHKEN